MQLQRGVYPEGRIQYLESRPISFYCRVVYNMLVSMEVEEIGHGGQRRSELAGPDAIPTLSGDRKGGLSSRKIATGKLAPGCR